MPYILTYIISLCYITHVAGCLCFWTIRPAEHYTESDCAPASYLDCSAFKSRPTEWLSWLRLFLGFPCLYSQCQESTSNLAITASFHVLPNSFEFSFFKISMPPGVRCHRDVLCIICGASWNTFWHLSMLQSAMEQKHVTSTSCSASVWTVGSHNVFCKLGKSAAKLL